MTSRERVLAHLEGRPVDRLPLMPITMMFACVQIGARYRDYCTDYRVLVEGQIRTAEAFGFDYVNTMSDPAREAADCGAVVEYFDQQPVALVEDQALLADKTRLASLKIPDPLGGGRMHNSLKGLALLQERVGKELMIEGWVEGPIAEGADLRGINTLMLDFFDDPAFVRDLFAFVIEMELRFAREQIEGGGGRHRCRRRRRLAGRPGDLRRVRLALREEARGRHPRPRRQGAPAYLRQHPPHPGGHGQARLRHRGPGLHGPHAPKRGRRWAPAPSCSAT